MSTLGKCFREHLVSSREEESYKYFHEMIIEHFAVSIPERLREGAQVFPHDGVGGSHVRTD